MNNTEHFGLRKVDDTILSLYEKAKLRNGKGGEIPHLMLRGYCKHLDLDKFLEAYIAGKEVFVYTGRGPSGPMHVGHLPSFILFMTILIDLGIRGKIQIADDEKMHSKDIGKEEMKRLTRENVKDMLAMGIEPVTTDIFSNRKMSSNVLYNDVFHEVLHNVNLIDVLKVFGFPPDTNMGTVVTTIYQILAAFGKAYANVGDDATVLVVMGEDQYKYFLLARDIARKLGYPFPCCLVCGYVPSLMGEEKMSTTATGVDPVSTKPPKPKKKKPRKKKSSANSSKQQEIEKRTIFLSDSKKKVRKKMGRAYSGGQDTLEEQIQKGADTEKDVAYKYLRIFSPNHRLVQEVYERYSKYSEKHVGEKMKMGEVKKIAIEMVCNMLERIQQRRSMLTDEEVDKAFLSMD